MNVNLLHAMMGVHLIILLTISFLVINATPCMCFLTSPENFLCGGFYESCPSDFTKLDYTGIYIGTMILLLVTTLFQAAFAGNFSIIRYDATGNSTSPYYYCQFCTCAEDESFIDCSRKGIFKPPREIYENATVLLLNENYIKTVKYEPFRRLSKLRVLHLANNTISVIEPGAFRDLESLEQLYMDGNRMLLLQASLKPGIFIGLGNLTLLTLHRNVEPKLVSRIDVDSMVQVFQDLISLETLYIDGVQSIKFKDPFKPLTKLTTIVMTDVHPRMFCNVGTLTADAFEGVPNMRNLTIRHCNLTKIEAGAFWGLDKLYHLDLSWNVALGFREFGRALEGLQRSNLTVLHASAIHNPLRAGTDVERADVRYLRRMPLREMYMDDNAIEYIHYGVLSMFPTTLRHLYMRRNRLRFGIYMEEVIFNNPSLQVFDASDQEIGVRSRGPNPLKGVRRNNGYIVRRDTNQLTERHLSGEAVESGGYSPVDRTIRSYELEILQLSLKRITCSGSLSDMHPLNFTRTINNITHIDISRNYIPTLRRCAFDDLPVLESLNLSSNSLEYVHGEAFYGLTGLKVLDLSDNLLGNALSLDINGHIFRPLQNLQFLNLTRNRLFLIEKNVFIHLQTLRSLDLSRNNLRTLGIDLSYNVLLQNLNIALNRIDSIKEGVRNGLDRVASNHQMNVSLLHNDVGCKCETIPFLEWLLTSPITFEKRDEYACLFNNGTSSSLDDLPAIIDYLAVECTSYLVYIVSGATGGSFIASLILSYFVYRNRWKLRYMYHMAKAKLDLDGPVKYEDLRFDFDAFVSYADGDRPFVIQNFVDEVEAKGGLRLNIRDRDFEIGESVAVNISKAIRTSKKTVLLLSRHFLRNKWCNFEMNMALMEGIHTGRKVLVVIFLEEIPANAMPLDLINILKDAPKTDFPNDDHLQPVFWKRCIDFFHDD